jgi:hypothetical protein
MGSSIYSGPGAGRYPTANSIVNDIMRVAHNQCASPAFPLRNIPGEHTVLADFSGKFYFRITIDQTTNAKDDFTHILLDSLEKQGIQIAMNEFRRKQSSGNENHFHYIFETLESTVSYGKLQNVLQHITNEVANTQKPFIALFYQ